MHSLLQTISEHDHFEACITQSHVAPLLGNEPGPMTEAEFEAQRFTSKLTIQLLYPCASHDGWSQAAERVSTRWLRDL